MEVPAGAFVVPWKQVNGLRVAMLHSQWLKSARRCVTSYKAPDSASTELARAAPLLAAIHASPLGASVMNAHAVATAAGDGEARRKSAAHIPAIIAALLEDPSLEVTWVPDLRILSPECAEDETAHRRGVKRPAPSEAVPPPPRARDFATPRGTFTFSELFAGIGGFGVALGRLGGACVFASEIDPEARAVFVANLPPDRAPPLVVGDITEVSSGAFATHDILTGGFPCQSFSMAGNERKGFGAPTGQLFFEVTRVLRAAQPKGFLLENVANLVQHDGGHTFATVLAELRGCGYLVDWRVVNTRSVLPQQRSRVYLVGVRADLRADLGVGPQGGLKVGPAGAAQPWRFAWPELPVLPCSLGDVLEPPDSGVDADPHFVLSAAQFAKLCSLPDYAKDPALKLARLDGAARTLMASYRRGWQHRSELVWRGFGGRGAGSATAGQPSGGKAELARVNAATAAAAAALALSPRPRFYTQAECARLQGFPASFSFAANGGGSGGSGGGADGGADGGGDSKTYRQLGNAVSPPVVAAIAAQLLEALGIAAAGVGPDPCGGGGGGGGGSGDSSDSPLARRRRGVGPALSLLLESYPHPHRPMASSAPSSASPSESPSASLAALVAAFLAGTPCGPPGTSGWGGAAGGVSQGDATAWAALLAHGSRRGAFSGEARLCALNELGRTLFLVGRPAGAGRGGGWGGGVGASTDGGGSGDGGGDGDGDGDGDGANEDNGAAADGDDHMLAGYEAAAAAAADAAAALDAVVAGGLMPLVYACLPEPVAEPSPGAEPRPPGDRAVSSRTAADSTIEATRLAVVAVGEIARLRRLSLRKQGDVGGGGSGSDGSAAVRLPLAMPKGAVDALRAVAQRQPCRVAGRDWSADGKTAAKAKEALAVLGLA